MNSSESIKDEQDMQSCEAMIEQLMEQVSRRNLRLAWYKDEVKRQKHILEEKELVEKDLVNNVEKNLTEKAVLTAENATLTAENATLTDMLLSAAQEQSYDLKTRLVASLEKTTFKRLLKLIRFPRHMFLRPSLFIKTKNKGLLLSSPKIFWSNWYMFQNSDVTGSSLEPYLHYLLYGWKENRTPHPLFDGEYYLKQNPDVAASGINPFIHYILQGWKEGRNPGPFFDVLWYLSNNSDVAKTKIEPLQHYFFYGWMENRKPTRDFSAKAFFSCYPHFKKPGWSGFDFMKHFFIMEIEEYVKSNSHNTTT